MSHWPARSPPLDFFAVTLALEESASELLDVTLAREDDRLGVPDHTEATSLPIRLLLRNKYFETYLFGLSTTLRVTYQEVI